MWFSKCLSLSEQHFTCNYGQWFSLKLQSPSRQICGCFKIKDPHKVKVSLKIRSISYAVSVKFGGSPSFASPYAHTHIHPRYVKPKNNLHFDIQMHLDWFQDECDGRIF